jgi:hypothetical protein
MKLRFTRRSTIAFRHWSQLGHLAVSLTFKQAFCQKVDQAPSAMSSTLFFVRWQMHAGRPSVFDQRSRRSIGLRASAASARFGKAEKIAALAAAQEPS